VSGFLFLDCVASSQTILPTSWIWHIQQQDVYAIATADMVILNNLPIIVFAFLPRCVALVGDVDVKIVQRSSGTKDTPELQRTKPLSIRPFTHCASSPILAPFAPFLCRSVRLLTRRRRGRGATARGVTCWKRGYLEQLAGSFCMTESNATTGGDVDEIDDSRKSWDCHGAPGGRIVHKKKKARSLRTLRLGGTATRHAEETWIGMRMLWKTGIKCDMVSRGEQLALARLWYCYWYNVNVTCMLRYLLRFQYIYDAPKSRRLVSRPVVNKQRRSGYACAASIQLLGPIVYILLVSISVCPGRINGARRDRLGKGKWHSQKENHQHPKHLGNQPAIPTHPPPILQQFPLRTLHIIHHILRIRIDPLNHLTLLTHHTRQLTKDPPQLRDRALDGLDGLATLLDVRVLRLRLLHHQQLRVADRIQRQQILATMRRRRIRRVVRRRTAPRRRRVQRARGLRRAGRQRVRAHAADEVLGARPRGADVLGAQLEHVFEVRRDVGEFALQQEDDVLGVLGLLGCCGGGLGARERLEGGDLRV